MDPAYSEAVSADLDGDGRAELVVNFGGGLRAYVLRRDGAARDAGGVKGAGWRDVTGDWGLPSSEKAAGHWFFPEDLDADVSQAEAVLAGEIDTYTIEKRYISRDGAPIWIDLTVSLVRKANGEPDYFVSVIVDIASRKQAEAEQQRYQGQLRLMINELNHRVKNTLATVQSMAAQTLRHDPDPASAYLTFEARLMGLAEVHDVLTRESWHGAALHEVAERALRPFGDAASAGQVSCQLPKLKSVIVSRGSSTSVA